MKGSFLFFTILVLSVSCNTVSHKNLPVKNEAASVDSIQVKLQLVTDVPQVPVQLNVAGDESGKAFITDNRGKIWILQNDVLLPKPFFNLYEKIGKQKKASPAGMVLAWHLTRYLQPTTDFMYAIMRLPGLIAPIGDWYFPNLIVTHIIRTSLILHQNKG